MSNLIPASDTETVWKACRYANLRRYVPSGIIFAHAKVHGTLVRRSLKTKSEIIAKAKLDKLLESERKRLSRKLTGESLCGGLIDEYLSRTESSPDLKPTTKQYRRETVKIVRATWPELEEMQPQKINQQDAVVFAASLRAKYGPSRFNGTLETLRAIFQLGIELGVVGDNPVVFTNRKRGIKGINRAKIVPKDWKLPSPAGFTKLLDRLHALPSRLRGSRSVRFLVFSGLRPSAARKVVPSDVDLDRNFLSKPPIKHTHVPQRLPMFKELRQVCEELLADYPGEGPLLPIANPRKALRNSCLECGLEPLTPQALRHLFTTRCLESGVDVRTVAEWRGDRDNGAMLLRVYAHVIDSHSQRMAKKVRF